MTVTLDQIIAEIIGAKPDEVYKDVVPLLKKLDKSSSSTQSTQPSLLEGMLNNGKDPLESLNPVSHSVGLLFLLNARLAAATPDLNELQAHILDFSEKCDPAQLRLVPDQVNFFVKQLIHIATEASEPSRAVVPAINILARYTPRGYLTALHPHVVNLVMNARAYSAARDLLQQEILDLDTSLGQIKYHDNLAYHYLGGIIMTLLGEYTRASDMLEIVVSAPGQAVAQIQIDAFKKLQLVQLISSGKTHPLPKYTTPAVVTACRNHGATYLEYAQAYAHFDTTKMGQLVEKGREGFEKDLNTGLLVLCDQAYLKRSIQKLTETYMTLSVREIARHVGGKGEGVDELKEVERVLLEMIHEQQIFGSLSHTGGEGEATVTFTDDPEPFNSHGTVKRVTWAIENAAARERYWEEEARRVERSKEFVVKAYTAAGQASLGGNSGMGGFGGGFGGGAGGEGDEEGDFGVVGADWEEGEED